MSLMVRFAEGNRPRMHGMRELWGLLYLLAAAD